MREIMIPLEKEIIEARFCFNNRKKKTLKQLSKKYNLSTETIRLMEINTLKKLRADFPELKDFLYDK